MAASAASPSPSSLPGTCSRPLLGGGGHAGLLLRGPPPVWDVCTSVQAAPVCSRAPHLCPCLAPRQLTSTRSTTRCSPATPSTPCSCTSRPSRRPTGSSSVETAKSKGYSFPFTWGPCPRAAGGDSDLRRVTCHCARGTATTASAELNSHAGQREVKSPQY